MKLYLHLCLFPLKTKKNRYQSDNWIRSNIEKIASWYQQQIWVTNVKVDILNNRLFLKVTAQNGEFYSQMITDPDQDGNYPLTINKHNYGMSGRLISFYINV